MRFLGIVGAVVLLLSLCAVAESAETRDRRRKRRPTAEGATTADTFKDTGRIEPDEEEGKWGRIDDEKAEDARLDRRIAAKTRGELKGEKMKLAEKELVEETRASERKAKSEEEARNRERREFRVRTISIIDLFY